HRVEPPVSLARPLGRLSTMPPPLPAFRRAPPPLPTIPKPPPLPLPPAPESEAEPILDLEEVLVIDPGVTPESTAPGALAEGGGGAAELAPEARPPVEVGDKGAKPKRKRKSSGSKTPRGKSRGKKT